MSIIHEALKKVQNSFMRKKQAPEADANGGNGGGLYAQQPPQPQDAPKKPKTSIFTSIIVLLVVLGSILYLYKQVVQYLPEIKKTFNIPDVKLKEIPLPSLTVKFAKTPKPAQVPPSQPLAKVKADPNAAVNSSDAAFQNVLNIQGVMTQGGVTVALINDKIYEAGDEVSGIKILSITSNAITLLRSGKEETIKVRR